MLVNEVHANELNWLVVVNFAHDCLTQGRYQSYGVSASGSRAPWAPPRASEKGTYPRIC
jgi:hypothetical protein